MPTAFKIECKKDKLYQNQDGTWKLTLTCHQEDMRKSGILDAPMGTQYIAAFAEYDGEEPEQPKERREWGNVPRSEQAGIRCNEPAFQEWCGYPIDTIATASYVREMCGVESRKELNTNEVAGDAWDALDKTFRLGIRM